MREPVFDLDSIHELLLRWGQHVARQQDRAVGYPAAVGWLTERMGGTYKPLEPAGFSSPDFERLESALAGLPQPLRVAVLCYYVPGRLRSMALDEGRPLGIDGRGRAISPSMRSIAAYLLISPAAVQERLRRARRLLVEAMNLSERLAPALMDS